MESVISFSLKETHIVTESGSGAIWGLAWNPASPLCLAAGSTEHAVRLWEIVPSSSNNYTEKAVFEDADANDGTVVSCAWSPCGKLLAITSSHGTTSIFKYKKGSSTCLFKFFFRNLKGGRDVDSVSWSASGSLIATCESNRDATDNIVCVWKIKPDNIASRPRLAVYPSFYSKVKQGNRVFLASMEELVCLWNVEQDDEFELVAYLPGHASNVTMVQWHPTEDILFSCSADQSVKVWADQDGHNNNWQCVQTLGGGINCHSSIVWGLAFNPSGDKMVTCSEDCTLKVWEPDNIGIQPGNRFERWRHLYTLTGCHDGIIFSVHWSRQGIIASGGKDGIGLLVEDDESHVGGPLYKLKMLLKVKAHDGYGVNSVQWSPGENRLLASTSDDETIKVWELEQANEEVQTSNPEANEEDQIRNPEANEEDQISNAEANVVHSPRAKQTSKRPILKN